MTAGLLEVAAVSRAYGIVPVLRTVTFGLDGPEIVALAGPSGSGKSTLCHLVAGVGRPSAGEVRVLGRPAHEVDDWAVVSLLPQRLGLAGELSVTENVLLPLRVRPAGEPPPGSDDLLARLGLAGLTGRASAQTSLGEQQRTALARALVLVPRLAVLDEPTGHQDDEHVGLVLAALQTARAAGTAVLVATHDDRVLAVADRVVGLRPAPSGG